MATLTESGRVIYTAKVHTTGGREDGLSRSSDGRLDIRHFVPGGPGNGTNPEQLFAAGWSACFEGAIGVAAYQTCPYSKATRGNINVALNLV